MTAPPSLEWEPERIPGGWLIAGPCGGWHIVKRRPPDWQCPVCPEMTRYMRRHESTAQLRADQARLLDLFYPTEEIRSA
jgi:hypothetical protein